MSARGREQMPPQQRGVTSQRGIRGVGRGVHGREAGAAPQVGSEGPHPPAVHQGMPGGVQSFVFRASRPFHPRGCRRSSGACAGEMAALEEGDSWDSLAGAPGASQGHGKAGSQGCRHTDLRWFQQARLEQLFQLSQLEQLAQLALAVEATAGV